METAYNPLQEITAINIWTHLFPAGNKSVCSVAMNGLGYESDFPRSNLCSVTLAVILDKLYNLSRPLLSHL